MDQKRKKQIRDKSEVIYDSSVSEIQKEYQDISVDEILHELKVHQVELKNQNEELRKSEYKLSELKDKYFSLFETAPIGYIVIDLNNVILETNLTFAGMLGYDKKFLIGSKFTDYIIDKCQDDYYFFRQNLSEKNIVDQLFIKLKSSDNKKFYVALNSGLVMIEDEVCIRFAVTDISKQKKLEKKLLNQKKKAEESANVKNRFLATMSHELRTPLNTIIGTSEILINKIMDSYLKNEVSVIKKTANHLSMIISDILDYSHIEEGKFVLHSGSENLKMLVDDCYNMLKWDVKKKNLDFRIEMPDSDIYFEVDGNRLKQIIVNLLSNALKFTDSGFILLKVSFLSDELIQFEVEDSGIGIDKEKLDYIFEGFAQTDNSFMKKSGGSGLGLTIVKNLVHLMKGEVSVESEVNKGTIFRVVLPLKKISKPYLQKENVENESESIVNPKYILLAEDNKINAKMGMVLLKTSHFRVDIAYNGKEALDMALNNNYDVILMDIEMPIMSGIESTREIRKQSKNRIPIYALTAHMRSSIENELEEGLFDEIIEKPINIKKIEKLLK